MDIGKSFTFVFDDNDWIPKILVAGAILLVGILFSWVLLIPLILAIALMAGYSLEITRRVIKGDPTPLPAWDNWGELIVDGLKVIVIGIVYALPFILISACLGIPVGFLGEGSDVAQAFSALFSVALGTLNLLWGIIWSLLFPAAIGFFADEGELGAAFRFGDVFGLVRRNFGTYLITMLLGWVASVIGSLGSILCGIGWFVTQPYSSMVTGHLYGQAYLAAGGGQVQPAVVEEDPIVEDLDF
jgi:hypothetical protein